MPMTTVRRGRGLRLAFSLAALLAGALGLAAPKAERSPPRAAAAPPERTGRLAESRPPRVLSLAALRAAAVGLAVTFPSRAGPCRIPS